MLVDTKLFIEIIYQWILSTTPSHLTILWVWGLQLISALRNVCWATILNMTILMCLLLYLRSLECQGRGWYMQCFDLDHMFGTVLVICSVLQMVSPCGSLGFLQHGNWIPGGRKWSMISSHNTSAQNSQVITSGAFYWPKPATRMVNTQQEEKISFIS